MMFTHGVDCHAFVRTLASLGGALARRTSPSAAPSISLLVSALRTAAVTVSSALCSATSVHPRSAGRSTTGGAVRLGQKEPVLRGRDFHWYGVLALSWRC